MEDEHGNNISPGVKAGVRGNLFSYWLGLFEGKVPVNWKDLDLKMKNAFRDEFEGMYPWLRLCEARWKVDHLWINYFGSWKKSHHPSPAPESVITSEKPSADASSETDVSDVSAGSKHGREEPEGLIISPSKRAKVGDKGKAREVFTPTPFHHSRPATKSKTTAKLSKVG